MHLHGLKLLVALIIILGNAIYSVSLADSSTKYNFNEVADFDDIIEEDKISVQANKKSTSRNHHPINLCARAGVSSKWTFDSSK
ncbi:hypothetical protein JTB14_026404 [Gonioctena quinquepunctata]|nr:hypothetical protein JTB14_026404 [Gonioctena quinquepunctata]